MRPSVLWVTQERLHATAGGGAQRQLGLLHALAPALDIYLLVVGEPPDPALADELAEVITVPVGPPEGLRSRFAGLRALVDSRSLPEVVAASEARMAVRKVLGQRADLRVCQVSVATHLPLAPLLPHLPGATIFHPFHVVGPQLEQEAAHSSWARALRLRRYARNASRLEAWAVATADATVVVSAGDAQLLAAAGERRPPTVVPNGVDPASVAPPRQRPAAPTVLFPASLGYAPNVDGALWMATTVWPLVRELHPEARLLLVGRSPGPQVQALATCAGVEVHADVPDMAPWFARARVVVVPLRFGTGTRIKALEALASGRPVVGTTIGLAGLGIEAGRHALVADDPAAFAQAVVKALGPSGDQLVAAGQALVAQSHTWPVVSSTLLDLIGSLARGRR